MTDEQQNKERLLTVANSYGAAALHEHRRGKGDDGTRLEGKDRAMTDAAAWLGEGAPLAPPSSPQARFIARLPLAKDAPGIDPDYDDPALAQPQEKK